MTRCAFHLILSFLGLTAVSAQPLVEGRVRLASGQPVRGAQVLLFDLADPSLPPVAATTDEAGWFALPWEAFPGRAVPEQFGLGPNYPNPFNPSTVIPYQLPAGMHVRLEIFNVLGQRLATLVDGRRPAGFHTASWEAADGAGRAVAAGVYLYRLTGPGSQLVRRMVLIDGPAGVPAAVPGGSMSAAPHLPEADKVYGLTVSGEGLAPYVDPSFRLTDRGPLELVVEAPRAKAASAGPALLGDVNGNGQVEVIDALLVLVYSSNPFLTLPAGDPSLGDVNRDGRTDATDARLILLFSLDPSDPALPEGLGSPVAPGPDLVVESLSVSGSPEAGESFRLVAAVRNRGTVRADATTVRFYLSADDGVSEADTQVGSSYVSRLDPEEGSEESPLLTAPSTGGTYYYIACVEPVSDERDTENNCSDVATLTIATPDLVVEALSVDEPPEAGERFRLGATVRNQGTGKASSTTLRYYLSSDAAIDTTDTLVDTDHVSSLAAGGSGEESEYLTAPSAAGTYYYGACVEGVLAEIETWNNCSQAVAVTLESPDLVVESLSVSDPPEAGERFRLEATVRNQGSGPTASTTLRYYLSTDATIDTTDTELTTGYVRRLAAGASSERSGYLTAPSLGGTYYYGACVDGVQAEIDTGNNCSEAVAVTIGSPDLVVESLSVDDPPEAGERFRLSATVRNQGSGQTASTTLRYYLSTDARIDTTDTEVDSDYVSRLAAGDSGDESGYLAAPSLGGTYYYGACVDAVQAEIDTANNCSDAVAVTIGSPDLVVESLALGDPPEAGERFLLNATVRNQGSGRSATTTLRYYRSTDAGIDRTDTEVDTDYVSRLAAGDSGDESASLTAPTRGGTYYYGACVDGVPGESDTADNCSEAVAFAIGSPDLVVVSAAVSKRSLVAGETFTFSATVRNQGRGRSAATTLRYYQSTDAVVGSGDTPLDSDHVSRLEPAGESEELSRLAAPSGEGTYYYGACVESVPAEGDTGNNCSGPVAVEVAARAIANQVPTFPEGSSTSRTLAENTPGGRDIGHPVAAADADKDRLSYGLEGSDAASFDIVASSGQLRTRPGVAYDYETKRSHSVRVRATDAQGGTVTISVRVEVEDLDEAPGLPAAPTVTSSTLSSLSVRWAAPENTGPAISDYDVQYRAGGTGPFTDWAYLGSGRATTITGLVTGTAYEVQVRATNGEGTGGWSPSVQGTTTANQAPAFDEGASIARGVAENTTGSRNIGAPVSATDSDRDRLTYHIEGSDAASFDILSSSGQLRTRAGMVYDHETKSSHSVRVRVEDGRGGSAATEVTISVEDQDEPPGRPGRPDVTVSTLTSLTVTWTAPGNTGPAITDYDLRYRESGRFIDWAHDGAGTATSIRGLAQNNRYEVQVRAVNAEGAGEWSPSVHGTTTANQVPTFHESSPARTVAENTMAGQDVGQPVSATDSDGGTLTYGLEGPDAASFDIVPSNGQLRTRTGITYDHEAKDRYSVRVRAEDGQGGSATAAVRIDVEDVDEAPGRPPAPGVTSSTTSSLSLGWTAPDNTGPAITDYDVQYRAGSSGAFTDWAHSGSGTTATITGLVTGTAYEVQVRAVNDEGTGDWSPSGGGTTTANRSPTFAEGSSTTRDLAENTAAGRDIGGPVSAMDLDGGNLTYSLEGPEGGSFDIVSGSGQLRTRSGATYDHEVKTRHSVNVRVEDGQGGSATIAVTVEVRDVDEAPGRPAAPTVTSSTLSSLSLSWTAPANTGPAIIDYDVQYRAGGSGPFTDWAHGGAGTTATITGLVTGTTYEVQVRASSDEGAGDWSRSVRGTTTANLAPVFDESSPTRSVTENTAAGQDIEHPVSATDAEGGTLTWRLEGPEAGSFDIVSGSGQLRTRAGVTYNYEVDDSYSVRVRVEDDQGGSTATEVTIHVEDVDEAPGRPAVPRITASTTHGLSVAWTAPANTGPPLGGYDLQYREGSSGAFTDGGRSTGTTAALTGLATGTDYEIQVRARNDEGDGPWSPSAAGRTTVNQAPAFAEGSSTVRTVAENTPAGRDIGGPVNANDRDGGTLMYRLEGPDAASFDLVSTSGQLRTRSGVTYDHESDSTYSVQVRVEDGQGGSATIDVAIALIDVDEAPSAPTAPGVAASTLNSLTVSWSAPANTGPPIGDYDVQYREGRSGAFTDWPHNGTGTASTIAGLTPDTDYEVQVRATSSEGTGSWSPSVEGRTTANQAPAFTEGASATRGLAENAPAGRDIGNPVSARDRDGGTLAYDLEGVDAASFDIVSTSGQLRTRSGVIYDHETKTSHSVQVRVEDGQGGSATIPVTVQVEDVDEPPERPAAPAVTASTSSSLTVGWTEPANTGPDIGDYDVQYRAGSSGGFIDWPHAGPGASATITGLVTGAEYEVQVRATNDEGTSGWSPSGRGTTTANQAPAFTEGAGTTRSLAENTAAGQDIGNPVTATDRDGGTLTYTLGGSDAASFEIVSNSGQLRTRAGVGYNYEVEDSYSVRVSVDDSQGGTAAIDVEVAIDDVEEPPGQPAAPAVTGSMSNSLTVNWTAPDNTGPEVDDYDVQYRAQGGSFADWAHSGTGTAATITGLTTDTAYEVQVRATNDEGTGNWSPSASGRTSRPGLAPADQAAFDDLVAGMALSAETHYVEFPSDGRFEESDAHPGSHSYANTGPGTGTLTRYYDDGEFGGSCTSQMTFTAATAGTLRLKCGATGAYGPWMEWKLTEAPDPDSFDIEIVWVGPEPSAANRAAFEAAAARWERVITEDLPEYFFFSHPGHEPEGEKIYGLVDDLRIQASLSEIDGPGQTLGSAGPVIQRPFSKLPSLAQMKFDTADLARFTPEGLHDLFLHEMAHCLGFGFWERRGLLENPSVLVEYITVPWFPFPVPVVTLVDPPPDTHFTGPLAIAAFNAAGGSSYTGGKVPVENEKGGQGTQDGHWRQSVFGPLGEVMEGYANPWATARAPLSAITIQSLADLGYTVDLSQADPYTLPSRPAGKLAASPAHLIPLNCILHEPVAIVEEGGRVIKKPWNGKVHEK